MKTIKYTEESKISCECRLKNQSEWQLSTDETPRSSSLAHIDDKLLRKNDKGKIQILNLYNWNNFICITRNFINGLLELNIGTTESFSKNLNICTLNFYFSMIIVDSFPEVIAFGSQLLLVEIIHRHCFHKSSNQFNHILKIRESQLHF